MSTRWWIAIGVVLAAIAAIAWRQMRGRESAVRKTHSTRLDPQALRTEQASRLERAKQLAIGLKSATSPSSNRKWPMQGIGPSKLGAMDLIHPCSLGPRPMCDALTDLTQACDGGDADACLAVGQFLQDTPPRPLIANVYFLQACRIGDASGCERLDELKTPSDEPCDRDAFACAWRAYRAKPPDRALLDESCALGVADSCAYMGMLGEDDVDVSRAYYETGCQLGSPMLCEELGERLKLGCVPDDHRRCYTPDPMESKSALEMACSSGFGSGCAP